MYDGSTLPTTTDHRLQGFRVSVVGPEGLGFDSGHSRVGNRTPAWPTICREPRISAMSPEPLKP